MIDIHCHILPGIDDGPSHLDGALALAEKAVAGGTTTVIATPHVTSRPEVDAAARIPIAVAALQEELDARGIALRLIPGAEVFPLDDLHEAIAAGAPVTLGMSRAYVLLDTPFSALPMGLASAVFALQLRGVTPILAHPERVSPVQDDPRVLQELVNRGVLLQVTTGSILGEHGQSAAKAARTLLEHRWVHFVASDAHSAGRRGPGQRAAAEDLRRLLPADEVDALVLHNGRRVLDGTAVPSEPRPFTPKRWWHFGR